MEYREVRFMIETGYEMGKGLAVHLIRAFEQEVVGMFLANGWELKEKSMSGASSEVVKGKNHLYCHPMSISGEVDSELIETVSKILAEGKTFKVEKMVVGDVLSDLSDDEFFNLLENKKEEIKAQLIASFTTPRKNQFVSSTYAIEQVKEKHHIQTLKHHIGRSCFDPEWVFTRKVFEDLVAEKKLVAKESNKWMYRAV